MAETSDKPLLGNEYQYGRPSWNEVDPINGPRWRGPPVEEENEPASSTPQASAAPGRDLVYKITDSPPIYMSILFGLQQTLLSLAGSLIAPLLVANIVCVGHSHVVVSQIASTTMMMNGIASLMQTLIGIRLPLFQGPCVAYIIPLMALATLEPDRCNIKVQFADRLVNGTNGTDMESLKDELIYLRLRELMGPLIVCGIIHCLIGLTGLIGFLLRFVGPITIIPTLLLVGMYIVKPTLPYIQAHYGISMLVWAISVILSMYLGSRPMPIPVYTPEKGFHIIRYPVHQVFALLIAILFGWAVSGIITATDAIPDDTSHYNYKTRTDTMDAVIEETPWFYFPYPGQFGGPLFSISGFIGFLIATMTSVLDSIGSYYACASICRAPPPPSHAVNRGIAVEGFCSMLAGWYGAAHATTTYGGNIGAIGMTKAASRHVFVAMGIMYVVLAIISKLTAVFVSIPYPVLGGVLITIMGAFYGLVLSNLQVVDLASNRNMTIIGMSLFIGLLVPAWVETNPTGIDTGSPDGDTAIKILIGNPNFVGSIVACILDNTVPGTLQERGIAFWREDGVVDKAPVADYLDGPEIYDPLLPRGASSWRIMKYIPIFPYTPPDTSSVRESVV